MSMPTDAQYVAAVLLSPFVRALTPDTRLFAGAIVAIIAVNAVRPSFHTSQKRTSPVQQPEGVSPCRWLLPMSSLLLQKSLLLNTRRTSLAPGKACVGSTGQS